MESKPTSDAPAESESHSDAPSTQRLVIRIKLTSQEQPPPVRPRLGSGALLALGAATLAILIAGGVILLRDHPRPAMPASAPSKSAHVPSSEPAPKVADPAADARSTAPETKSSPPGAVSPASQTKEVIPRVPRSARETIRGTIRVAIRVVVGNDGAVLAATTDEPGPSRYFERLATEAAKQWTFAPADSAEPRIMVVTFSFKRTGTTGRASPYNEPAAAGRSDRAATSR